MGAQELSRGRFITLEGGEGTGKSTQAGLLVEALARAGIRAIKTREPGGAPGAEAIRKLLVEGDPARWDALSEALLVAAARRNHLRDTVWPALEAGISVVCDRFADSTIAYQGYGGGVPRADLDALQHIVAGDFRPDLTLILDLPVEVGMARAAARAGSETRFEKMGPDFHERLRRGFLEIAASEPGRCVLIDAQVSMDDVHRAILAALRARLGLAL
ncbi:MAG TPA: dTMP kinase [Stellaceae bacterium]|nr:dTMP kinase [Stellaceae bacterium]